MVRDYCLLCFLHSLSLQKAQKIPGGSCLGRCPVTFWNILLPAVKAQTLAMGYHPTYWLPRRNAGAFRIPYRTLNYSFSLECE